MALSTNLVSYYKLDESSGNAVDSVGSITMTNNGTLTYGTGKLGNGADGGTGSSTKQLINTTQCPLTYAQLGSGFSISFWLKPNQTLTGLGGEWVSVTATNGSLNKYLDIRYDTATNTIRPRFGDSVGNNYFNTGINPTSGTWYHIVCTYDGTTFKIYSNSSIVYNSAFTNSAGYAASQTSCSLIGNQRAAGSAVSNAMVDEVGFWTRALSAGEIRQLYNYGTGLQYSFANPPLAVDAITATSGSAGVTSKTFSHTCTGDNRYLIVAAGKASARTITGVTYAGVSMTKADEITQTAGNVTVQLWYLKNPSSGANNVVISVDSSSSLSGGAISFIGADQTTQPDATTKGGNTTTGVTSYSQNLTTNTNNTMSVCCMLAASGATLTAGTDTTIASQPEVAAHGLAMTYTTTPLATAGTENLTVTSSSQVMVGVMASIKEFAVSSNSGFFMFM